MVWINFGLLHFEKLLHIQISTLALNSQGAQPLLSVMSRTKGLRPGMDRSMVGEPEKVILKFGKCEQPNDPKFHFIGHVRVRGFFFSKLFSHIV